MTDARLRALSRDAVQGDPTAFARLLVERVRAGELSAERLRLAAWLGDARALAAVGPGVVRPQSDELLAWLHELTVFGPKEAVIRAFACVGLSAYGEAGEDPEVATAVSVFRRWMERPVADVVMAQEVGRMAARVTRRPGSRLPLRLCTWAAQLAGSQTEPWVHEARLRLTEWSEFATDDPRPAIRAALLPWALGEQRP